MLNDTRYSIAPEFTGHASEKPQYVVRFCGNYVGASPTIQEAQGLASLHVAKRGLDLVARWDGGAVPVLWLKRGKMHRVAYGADIFDTDTKTTDIDAAHRFGECVRHSAECAGLLD